MTTMKCFTRRQTTALMTLLLVSAMSHAQERGCIELSTLAETEQKYVDEQGRNATRLVPAGKVVPGNEVVWTITAKNICNAPAENIVIANPVPEHMSYVASSAIGVGTEITVSVDGKQFMPTSELQVKSADGASRPARADEIRAIRWTYTAPFPKGATAFVRYRATVN
jgi:uncharacterized repeat protein (TIGR01451 family)